MEYLGSDMPKLGFGFMRLPMIGKEVDFEQTKAMVDLFMERGFKYFDTAYVYLDGMSEPTLGKALCQRYPRDSFYVATKMSLWPIKSAEELEPRFTRQLSELCVEYIDFYLVHSITEQSLPLADKFNAWDFILAKKAEGKIKHCGFSFHSTPEMLDKVLTDHPEMEFVQLQINYEDWESEDVQSRKCYEVARKHGKSVIIMEPVRGGALAKLPPKAHNVLHSFNPQASDASWAVRFAASLDGLITVLSGMSDLAQLDDNTKTMQNFKPLSDAERETLKAAKTVLDSVELIPCTGCKYCVKGCPKEVPIPGVFEVMNEHRKFQNLELAKRSYGFSIGKAKASDCIGCGACEQVCPQHIKIPELLKEAAKLYE